jgi:MoaA/NifB/PqqE/SkfB family radical SAM enzyme
MQPPGIKLKEIIWEITGACRNRCNYCGSKECWEEVVDECRIRNIIDAISVYPPEAIDISGGDPLLVSFETHRYIKEKLKDLTGVTIKILINPKSFSKLDDDNIIKILALYDWIGISINTEEELKKSCLFIIPPWLKKCTVITNFNLTNIHLYNTIEEFVKNNELAWQIQMTMYKEDLNKEALYSDKDAVELLSLSIQKSIKEGVKVIPADNINNGSCGAGVSCLGILSNGDVVPCLSMRSYRSIIEGYQNNILVMSLKEIWENYFKEERFKPHKCCKDYSGNVNCWLGKSPVEEVIRALYLVSVV